MKTSVSNDIQVQCTRCKNRHMESERIAVRGANGLNHLTCPRCKCRSFHNLRPQIAWCWASGLVEVGDLDKVPADSIVIARGPNSFLHGVLSAVCRQGRGASAGKLLVPGVPEASDQAAGADALGAWLNWCAGHNGKKGRHDVVFETEN